MHSAHCDLFRSFQMDVSLLAHSFFKTNSNFELSRYLKDKNPYRKRECEREGGGEYM